MDQDNLPNMQILNDVHQQFAAYFPSEQLRPWLYLLSKKLSEGHICVDTDKVDDAELAAAGYNHVLPKSGLLTETLVSDGTVKAPFVLFNDKLYLERYFNYESILLNRVTSMIAREPLQREQRLEKLRTHAAFIKELFKDAHTGTAKVINWPLAAAVTTVLNDFTIITGGPGTGKTTTVAKILSILFTMNPALKVALTAPTGKAAARMAESLRKNAAFSEELRSKLDALEPATFHRLLGNVKNSPHFKHNHENPLKYDVVIADESSMIDVALFAKLVDAIGPSTKLILLGDKDQLASVEAGSLFGDLCLAQNSLNRFSSERASWINSFISDPAEQISNNFIEPASAHPLFEHIIELQRSHRFSDNKGIGKFSKAIIHNKPEAIIDFFANKDDQVFIDPYYSEKVFENFVQGYKDFIDEKDIQEALKKLNNLRVLCAVREGEQGVHALNRKIERLLQQKNLLNPSGNFYLHRPIMVTSNNKELQLFNGDTGIIRPDENGILKAWFEASDGGVRSVLPGYIDTAETVYAMTIHKSQGSEFDRVLVVLPKGENMAILTRELLYTAVTRAKQTVVVQGTETLVLQAADAIVQRGSGIIDRFKMRLV